MNFMSRLFATALLMSMLSISWASDSAVEKARKLRPQITWDASSATNGDFYCAGTSGSAVMGFRDGQIWVMIFEDVNNGFPDLVQISGPDTKLAKIKTEPLDVTDQDFNLMLGGTPEGYPKEKSCVGLVVDDGMVDPVHIFWNDHQNRFNSWRV